MATSSDVGSQTHQINELDLFSFPLIGRSLIEASAGTGKTYSLAFIYLRLLLGIGEKKEIRALNVDEILVVTFTQAATEELRYRIRQNIHQLRIACLLGHHQDTAYQNLIELIDDKGQALKRLLYAEQNMDEAAIFTIHGFCQKMLATYAFESGMVFSQTLTKDESLLYLRVVNDFWRENFTPLPKILAKQIWQYWRDPKALFEAIKPYLNRPLPENIQLSSESLSGKMNRIHSDIFEKICQMKQLWLEHSCDIERLIAESDVKKNSYRSNLVPKWIEKITEWANAITDSYIFPQDILERFSQATLNAKTDPNKKPPKHEIFSAIEEFLSNDFELSHQILFDIVDFVNERANQQKNKLAQMGFDDSLNYLNKALQGDKHKRLAKKICHQYPVAMIDEFQDTDKVQYQIFDTIYHDRSKSTLVFIGDPKQAIYGFRGADIFTYIEAKKSVDHQFTMQTNWRSTPNMINGVNGLFLKRKHPFIFNEIPFISMESATKNQKKEFVVNDETISAMQCYLLPDTIETKNDYYIHAAECCAEQIVQWLSSESFFKQDSEEKCRLQSADIAVLVRSKNEAEIIQNALSLRNLKSVYLSDHKSVFDSLEAREILRILQAVLSPMHENHLRSALATHILGFSIKEIDQLNNDQMLLESIIDEFKEYQSIWFSYGVLVMLRRLMNHRQLVENLLNRQDGNRIITNLMHLSELLQEKAQELDTPQALVRWFEKQINNPDFELDNHEQRLESDENLISIITIHKSKGLEYPIVFLPFIDSYRNSTKNTYFDQEKNSVKYVHKLSPEIKDIVEKEFLAEELRLLYVAITRAIYHCSFSLAATKSVLGRKSAIGYLILDDEKGDHENLKQNLLKLNEINVIDDCFPISCSKITLNNQLSNSQSNLKVNHFKRIFNQSWRVTSYSGLLSSSQSRSLSDSHGLKEILPTFDSEVINEIVPNKNEYWGKKEKSLIYDIHHFPKGAMVGTLLHECFENMDFTCPDITLVVEHLLKKLNLNENWIHPLSDWFLSVLNTPLFDDFSLSKLSSTKRLDELQFYLPIHQEVQAADLDRICKRYDSLSKHCDHLNFSTVKGMLKGFIDLVFENDEKYYIIDYKSNFLGDKVEDYSEGQIRQAMSEHHYDFQYQLYSLALHRYLMHRMNNYNYNDHFGGVYYLFVRGMSPKYPQYGIYHTKPNFKLIEELNAVFG